MKVEIELDRIQSNVYSAKVNDYELQLRVEYPLKGVTKTTIDDVVEGSRHGTHGLLTPVTVCDGKTLVAVSRLMRNDAIVASGTVILLSRNSWSKFASYAKRPDLASKFVEVAEEVAQRWLANNFDQMWPSGFARSLSRIEEATNLSDAVDRLNGLISTIEGTRRLVPVAVRIRGDSMELALQSWKLLEAQRLLSDVLAKKVASLSEVRFIAAKLGETLGIER